MAKKTGTEILEVTVQRVKNTSDSLSVYAALTDDGKLRIVKQFTGPVRSQQRWCLAGMEVEDPWWGKQFVAQFSTLAAPRNQRELEAFLTSGLVDGWGYHEYYGLLNNIDSSAYSGENRDAFDLCANHSEQLAEIGGITPEMISSLQAAWRRGSGMAPIYAQLAEVGLT